MTKVLFTLLDDPPPSDGDREDLSLIKREWLAHDRTDIILCDDPAKADLIIYLHFRGSLGRQHFKRLRHDRLVAKYLPKLFTLNREDEPCGAVAGLYTSLRPRQYCPEIHRSWPYVILPNEKIYTHPVTDIDSASLLFSFRGNFRSNPLRAQIGRLYSGPSDFHQVEDIDKWYTHSAGEKESYLALIQNSVFALCPAGWAPYTHRIGEVMALGRVPVIISDSWIPFSFPHPDPYYILIAPADVPRIPDILRERRGEARMLANNARMLFQRYLSVGNRFPEAVKLIQRIQADMPSDCGNFYLRRWRSRKFQQANGWTLEQRLAKKVRKSRGCALLISLKKRLMGKEKV